MKINESRHGGGNQFSVIEARKEKDRKKFVNTIGSRVENVCENELLYSMNDRNFNAVSHTETVEAKGGKKGKKGKMTIVCESNLT